MRAKLKRGPRTGSCPPLFYIIVTLFAGEKSWNVSQRWSRARLRRCEAATRACWATIGKARVSCGSLQSLDQCFLTGGTPPQGGASPYAFYNMENCGRKGSVQFTHLKLGGAWNARQLLQGGVVEQKWRTTGTSGCCATSDGTEHHNIMQNVKSPCIDWDT